MQFENLRLIEPLLRAVRSEGYTVPTAIQVQAIPHVLAGKDLLGCAQTGTGKTAAFALPILQRLTAAQRPLPASGPRPIRVLVLSPTRELAAQIGDSFATYGRHTGLSHTVLFGGVGQKPQEDALRRGVDILVATPGRLLDLLGQGFVRFDRLEVLVLDEADRMLDMGFLPDVRRVINAVPKKRQTLMFSATMPEPIRELASTLLHDPVSVAVTPVSSTVDKIDQSVYFVEKNHKRGLLEHVLRDPAIERVLVFTRTKHGANRVTEGLRRANISAEVIHGNKAQNARTRAMDNFRSGASRVLVATDIAARGIDVEGITHVINYDLPNISESYVHRIGRTARAGASGVAVSFCDREERKFLSDIEKLIGQRVPVVADHPYTAARAPAPDPSYDRPPERQHSRQNQRQDGRSAGRQNNRSPRQSTPQPQRAPSPPRNDARPAQVSHDTPRPAVVAAAPLAASGLRPSRSFRPRPRRHSGPI
jgi:ATP-dependent RNA helicase RhlE